MTHAHKFTPAQQHRLHFVLDIFDSMEWLNQERIEAGLRFARQGNKAPYPEALVDLCAAPHLAAMAEGEWDGDEEAEAKSDIARVMAESEAIPDAGNMIDLDDVKTVCHKLRLEASRGSHLFFSQRAALHRLEAIVGRMERSPELPNFGPDGWLAPFAPTQAMRDAVRAVAGDQFVAYLNAVWDTARDAVLRGDIPKAVDRPPLDRWTPLRKEKVLVAVRDGRRTLSDVLDAYNITAEEFQSWRVAYEAHGLEGLKVKSIQTNKEG